MTTIVEEPKRVDHAPAVVDAVGGRLESRTDGCGWLRAVHELAGLSMGTRPDPPETGGQVSDEATDVAGANNQDRCMSPEPVDLSMTWTSLGLTERQFAEKAEWLAEPRRLGSGCEYFFHLAGRLLMAARQDHILIAPAFFHAVIGLERALRVHYKRRDEPYGGLCEGSAESFSLLLQRAFDEGLIFDEMFSEIRPLPRGFLELAKVGELPDSHGGKLTRLVPRLRNRYFHGTPLMSIEWIFVALQLREISDALRTRQE